MGRGALVVARSERPRGAMACRERSACQARLDPHILSRMAKQQGRLSDVFYALADPTRRKIVGALGSGPASVSALAAPFQMALPSFMKHLAVLERSGVIRSNKVGRVRTCELRPKALSPAARWMAEQRSAWEARTDRLSAFAEKLHQEELSRGRTRQRRR